MSQSDWAGRRGGGWGGGFAAGFRCGDWCFFDLHGYHVTISWCLRAEFWEGTHLSCLIPWVRTFTAGASRGAFWLYPHFMNYSLQIFVNKNQQHLVGMTKDLSERRDKHWYLSFETFSVYDCDWSVWITACLGRHILGWLRSVKTQFAEELKCTRGLLVVLSLRKESKRRRREISISLGLSCPSLTCTSPAVASFLSTSLHSSANTKCLLVQCKSLAPSPHFFLIYFPFLLNIFPSLA